MYVRQGELVGRISSLVFFNVDACALFEMHRVGFLGSNCVCVFV